MEFGTKEGRVRAQIEAVKSSLCAEGLADVADPIELQQAFDGFVTVRSTFNEKPHLLRLGFGWLEEQTPQGAVDWLRERHVADMLKDPDRREVRITDRGQIGGETEPTIIKTELADLRFKGGEGEIWLSASFAPKWLDDAVREAASVGPDARRREIVFVVCFAESYLLEWVRSDVLKNDFRRLNDYFPPGDQRSVTTKWKDVPKRLHEDKQIRGHPNYGWPFWADFVRLVDYRNGLAHARASRPDNDALAKEARPALTPRDLDAMPQGWPTRVVVALVRELHASAGTTTPAWLLDPP